MYATNGNFSRHLLLSLRLVRKTRIEKGEWKFRGHRFATDNMDLMKMYTIIIIIHQMVTSSEKQQRKHTTTENYHTNTHLPNKDVEQNGWTKECGWNVKWFKAKNGEKMPGKRYAKKNKCALKGAKDNAWEIASKIHFIVLIKLLFFMFFSLWLRSIVLWRLNLVHNFEPIWSLNGYRLLSSSENCSLNVTTIAVCNKIFALFCAQHVLYNGHHLSHSIG